MAVREASAEQKAVKGIKKPTIFAVSTKQRNNSNKDDTRGRGPAWTSAERSKDSIERSVEIDLSEIQNDPSFQLPKSDATLNKFVTKRQPETERNSMLHSKNGHEINKSKNMGTRAGEHLLEKDFAFVSPL